jgi:hypothetical protein
MNAIPQSKFRVSKRWPARCGMIFIPAVLSGGGLCLFFHPAAPEEGGYSADQPALALERVSCRGF